MSEPPRDETPPTWLTTDFLEGSLRKGLGNDRLKIIDSEMTMATAVGENYGSQMFRFNLTLDAGNGGTREKLSIIVKTIPSGKTGAGLRQLHAFEKEEEAFAKVLPRINALLERAYPDHEKLWADCYYHQGPPDDLLILEDLRTSGFILGNRFDGLDMEHSILVLKSLAKLHASSLAVQKQNPELMEKFTISFWNPEDKKSCEMFDMILSTFKTPFDILSEDVKNWTDFERREEFSEKLNNIKDIVLTKIFSLWEMDQTKLNVLLHGDSWVNNFMFKYDPTGKLSGLNFVDFQMMNYNTPALDLQYFIFTSTNRDIRFENVDFFLETYHEAFEDTLKRLNHSLDEPYTIDQLRKDFEDKYFWGLTVFCTVFPLFVLPPSEVFHPDEFFKEEKCSNFHNMFKREDLRRILQKGFLYFADKGVL